MAGRPAVAGQLAGVALWASLVPTLFYHPWVPVCLYGRKEENASPNQTQETQPGADS